MGLTLPKFQTVAKFSESKPAHPEDLKGKYFGEIEIKINYSQITKIIYENRFTYKKHHRFKRILRDGKEYCNCRSKW